MKPLRLISALPLLVALAACSPPATQAPVTPAVLVRSFDGAANAASVQTYTGEIRARFESELAFRVGGKMTERSVDVGALVTRGQLLARLDPQDAQLAATAARSQISAAEADAALARAELKRTEALLAKGFVSASALDSQRATLDAAEARLQQARMQAATASNQTTYTELHADSAGVITQVFAEAGQVVSAGQAVFRIARPGERELLIYVPESRIGSIETGEAVEVRPWIAQDQPSPGIVREVSPVADSATRTYGVRISLPDGDALPLGATATALFSRAQASRLVLPLSAVTRNGDQASIWLVDDENRLNPVAVDVLAFREDGAVLRDRLPEGSRVVVAGVHKLVAGAAVRPVEEGSTPALDVKR
ncbi:MAG: efflux RND transporter periplasmic adaptor subunit [Azoarcus sp. PHD]|nr:MAG: efflux RND transporter periplasmic adaptor subunit [Azoarcus sp. PHD]